MLLTGRQSTRGVRVQGASEYKGASENKGASEYKGRQSTRGVNMNILNLKK